MSIQTRFCDEVLTYDGSQLVSHWAFRRFGTLGDSIVSFCGPAIVEGAALVDLVDAREGLAIRSESMLHFIIEHFDTDLLRLVFRQRLFVAILADVVNEGVGKLCARRLGDDLYDGDAKLSVSIATLSPVSGLIHTGINVSSKNTPILTSGLHDLGLRAGEVASSVMERYAEELASAQVARCKVRSVP